MTGLLDGEAVHPAAAEHLASCAECLRQFQEMTALARVLDSWEVEGSDAWTGLKAQIQAEERGPLAHAPEMQILLAEMTALREEMVAMRDDVASLRRQLTAARSAAAQRRPGSAASPLLLAKRLLPFAPSSEPPARLT